MSEAQDPISPPDVPLHPVIAKLRRVEIELNQLFIGRSEEIRGALLALAARQHVFYLGAPGSAKSLLAAELARRIRGETFFKIDLNAFTLREELFGPISLRDMKERDALTRKVTGFLPTATIAVLDEIWKAPPSLLNTLLTLLNEREYRNDTEVIESPLISAFTTSNETPPADRSLDALYDRIVLRYKVEPLADSAERRAAAQISALRKAFEAEAKAELRRLRAARTAALAAELADAPESEHAAIGARHADAAIRVPRPERWLIDARGELFSDPATCRAVADGRLVLPVSAPERAAGWAAEDLVALVRHMARYAADHQLRLPYRTFLTMDDLLSLQRLVHEVTIPEGVDEAFYRVVDTYGGDTSVRREAEMRSLVAASAVLAGRTSASVVDLRVLAHCLWDREGDIERARQVVTEVTGDLEQELAAMLATIESWERDPGDGTGAVSKLDRLAQMKQEIDAFEPLASTHHDHPEVQDALERARAAMADYERRAFNFGPERP